MLIIFYLCAMTKKKDKAVISKRKQIGKLILNHREAQNISYYRLMEDLDLSHAQIKGIEKGSTAYTIDTFLLVCNAIDLKNIPLDFNEL